MIESQLPAPQRRAAEHGVPYRVHAVLTHRCSLACAHCYQAEHGGDELSSAELEGIFAELAGMGTLFLTLGGGEPMVRSDFWQLVETARRLGFAVDVYTNGLQVDRDAARRFKQLGVVRVSVSLHGVHALTHDVFVRRHGAFDRVNRAIDALEAEGVPVSIKTNLTAHNHGESEALRDRFANRPLVRLGISHRLHARDDGDTSPRQWGMTEAQERNVVRRRLERSGETQLQRILDDARRKLAFDDSDIVACQAARTTFALHPNGDVTPCTQTGGHIMGNVRQRGVREIWERSTVGDRFRDLTLDRFEDCASCALRKVCSHCAALSHDESGSLTGLSEQVCRSTKIYWSEVRRRTEELGLTFPPELVE